MTREEFLKQAESVKPGLTEEQFIQAVIKDVNMCEYLAAQGQMYPIYDRAQVDESCSSDEAEESLTRHVKYNADFVIELIEHVELEYKRKYGETNIKEIIADLSYFNLRNAVYFMRLKDVELFELVYLHLQNESMKQEITKLKSSGVSMELFIKKAIIDYFIKASKAIRERYENRKNASSAQTKYPVAIVEETVTSSPEAKRVVDSVVKAVNDEVSTIYDSVIRSCSEGQSITEADKQYFKDVAGMDIINKIKNNVAVTDAEWQEVVERICNKDDMIKNGDIAEEDWNYFMGVLSRNGVMYKLIETVKVLSNYILSVDNTESLASVGNMAAAAVNNTLHHQRMTPAEIANRLNRDKIKAEQQPKQPAVNNPAQQPNQPITTPVNQIPGFVDPIAIQKASQARTDAEVSALTKMILFIPNHTLMPQEIHDLYVIITSPEVQAAMESHQIIRNMNFPYIWELQDHKLFDKEKFTLVLAAESYKKDTRIVILINTASRNVRIRECPLMEVMKPTYK